MTIPTILTVEQAAAHLRLTAEDLSQAEYSDLEAKVAAATAIVIGYINTLEDAEIEAWTPVSIASEEPGSPPVMVGGPGSPNTTAPALVIAAVLIQLTELYRFRGDDPAGQGSGQTDGELSPTVRAILKNYHQPTLA